MSALRENDVVRYTPSERHAHEGIAVAYTLRGHLALGDTFWHNELKHIRMPGEWELLFNLNDYELLGRGDHWRWERYAPPDRAEITHQHGLQRDLYIRRGASEDYATIVENARNMLAEAERKRDRAEHGVQIAQRLLDDVLRGNDPWVIAR